MAHMGKDRTPAAFNNPSGATRSRAMPFDWRHGLAALVFYAFLAAFSAASPARAGDEENYKVVRGLGVYFGVIPAGMVRGPEATMHGGAPRGTHEYHLIVAVFDASTGARIEDATVRVTVSGLGHVGQNRFDLEPMSIAGTVTYGGFANFPGNDRYDIKIDISRQGGNAPVQVDFVYEHVQ